MYTCCTSTQTNNHTSSPTGGLLYMARAMRLNCDSVFLALAESLSTALIAPSLRPARHCSPRHRVPLNSRNEGSKCVG